MTQLCRRGRGLACSLPRPAPFLVAALWPGSSLRSWCVLRNLILASPSNLAANFENHISYIIAFSCLKLLAGLSSVLEKKLKSFHLLTKLWPCLRPFSCLPCEHNNEINL